MYYDVWGVAVHDHQWRRPMLFTHPPPLFGPFKAASYWSVSPRPAPFLPTNAQRDSALVQQSPCVSDESRYHPLTPTTVVCLLFYAPHHHHHFSPYRFASPPFILFSPAWTSALYDAGRSSSSIHVLFRLIGQVDAR